MQKYDFLDKKEQNTDILHSEYWVFTNLKKTNANTLL